MLQRYQLIIILCLFVDPTVSASAEDINVDENHKIIFTDANSNVRVETMRITAGDFGTPKSDPVWSIQKSTLHGGKQEGSELVTIDNGVMKIVVVPTRGMSVLRVEKYSKPGVPESSSMVLGWNSPVKEVVHPHYINLESRGGLGWLEGFNEWMVRCGLESAGHPGKDVFVNNVGDEVEMSLTLHGKIGNIPASKVTVSVDREPPNRIRVQGIVNERMFYGPKLELITEISTVPGATSFRISDELVNHGADDQEYQMIYHTNFGTPLLEKNARAIVAASRVEPMNDNAAKSIAQFPIYQAPTDGFIEEVYLVHPKSDSNGQSQALLTNATGDRGVSMVWNTSQLPYFTLWKNTAAEADGYVTGLEPGTGFPYNRNIERKFGRVPKLAPGQTRHFELEYRLHESADEVRQVASAITELQGAAPELATEPPTVPED